MYDARAFLMLGFFKADKNPIAFSVLGWMPSIARADGTYILITSILWSNENIRQIFVSVRK